MEAKVKPLYVLPFFIETFPHPNNSRTREDYGEIEIDKSFGDAYASWSTYDYDENGLLVMRSDGSRRTSYKYKKAQ